jgi:hypothetical protein
VLGNGYSNPEDVKLSSDGVSAYVTERSGDLMEGEPRGGESVIGHSGC